ncbi:MAG: hypothetical protein ABEI97_00775, partial [Candidatus Nanohaloarchaea archaeon]
RYSPSDEIIEQYEEIRTQEPHHALDMFDRFAAAGSDIFYEQWEVTFSGHDGPSWTEKVIGVDHDDHEWKNKVVGVDYSDLCVDQDTELAEVAELFEYLIDEEVYDTWRDLGRAAWRDDKDYLAAIGAGTGVVGGVVGATLIAPESASQLDTVIDITLGSGGTGMAGWGWKNLHNKYGPDDGVINGLRHILETGGRPPASRRGQQVRDDALDNLILLDPDYRKLGGGELEQRIQEEGEQFFKDKPIDSKEEWEELLRIPEEEARHSCKYIVAVLDPTPEKSHFWSVFDTYFPDHDADSVDDILGSDVAYSPTSPGAEAVG